MLLQDLKVYNKLFTLILEVHDLTLTFPKYELYELGSQLRRSSNGSAANLAEGFGNKHTNIFTETISRAQGEVRETAHHLRVANAKKYLPMEKLKHLVNEYEKCSKMLYGLEKSLLAKKKI